MKTLISTTLAAALGTVAGSPTVWIDSENRVVRDADHRQLLLHGVNVVYKVPPYMPDGKTWSAQDSLTDSDIADLKSWGFNFVRLGVMWEAVETAPGVYDEAYLAKVDALITRLGKAGIYTLVDAHQDAAARMTCGEGVPDFYAREIVSHGTYCVGQWADHVIAPILRQLGVCKSIKDYHFDLDKNGDPLIKECQANSFFLYYTSPEVWTIFRAIYDNSFAM